MAQLAIKAHLTRGKEVIEILKMLGGKNIYNYFGNGGNLVYFINSDSCGSIGSDTESDIHSYKLYSLEDFLEKFPYKVGEEVIAYAEGCLAHFTIQDIRWNNKLNKIEYKICSSWYDTSLMQPYKEETMKEQNKDNWAKWDLPHGYEFQDKEGHVIKTDVIKLVKKQSKYPKTFIEVLNFWHPDRQLEDDYQRDYKKDLIEKFQDLLYARDAYWKIAGDELGLGKSWERCHTKKRYVIRRAGDKIIKCFNISCVLEFPTEEIRDTFYENFKDLIEQCKELL